MHHALGTTWVGPGRTYTCVQLRGTGRMGRTGVCVCLREAQDTLLCGGEIVPGRSTHGMCVRWRRSWARWARWHPAGSSRPATGSSWLPQQPWLSLPGWARRACATACELQRPLRRNLSGICWRQRALQLPCAPTCRLQVLLHRSRPSSWVAARACACRLGPGCCARHGMRAPQNCRPLFSTRIPNSAEHASMN